MYLGDDGLLAVLIWAHCDDFFIHGPTYTKTAAALTAFLDLTVQLGLLCHPGKLTPPALEVKYTGLIFDTSGVPTIRIPEYKRAKAAALAQYAIDHRGRLSRLALAVIVGVLESLVEATPSRLGHTYLRNLQETLHPTGWDGQDLPYYSFASVSNKDFDGLTTNWLWLLDLNPGGAAQGHRSGVLVLSMGDGSGTGTGGTVQHRAFPHMDGHLDPAGVSFHLQLEGDASPACRIGTGKSAASPGHTRLRLLLLH